MSGLFVSYLLSYFRFGQTRSEAKTRQIVLESFCVHSPAHAPFYLLYGGSSCLSSLSSLNLPSFTVESTLSSPCSRSDPPSLAHLDSLPPPLMIWYSGQTALFLFLLARTAPALLPTALSVALKPLFSFRQAQYVQVSPLKPAPFCMLFAGVGSTNKSVISLLLSDSRSVLATLYSRPPFLLSQTLW